MSAGRVVVLIGPPGAGKSTVGLLVAQSAGTVFRDSDDLVAKAAGKPVGDIFVEDGEAVFREHERAAVARALDDLAAGGVLALGSGAVLDADVRRMITARTVVYLQAKFSTVARRTGLDKPRVVFPGNPRGRLRAMLEERRVVYEELASVTVPADELTPREIMAQVIAALPPEDAR